MVVDDGDCISAAGDDLVFFYNILDFLAQNVIIMERSKCKKALMLRMHL